MRKKILIFAGLVFFISIDSAYALKKDYLNMDDPSTFSCEKLDDEIKKVKKYLAKFNLELSLSITGKIADTASHSTDNKTQVVRSKAGERAIQRLNELEVMKTLKDCPMRQVR